MLELLLIENHTAAADLVEGVLAKVDSPKTRLVRVPQLDGVLDTLKTNQPDVLLLALRRPTGDCVEALAQLQHLAPSVPIIGLIDAADEALTLDALRNGAQECVLTGSLTPESVVLTIRAAIERKRIESKARRSEEQWRILAQEAFDYIFVLDPQGRFRSANMAISRMTGLDESELVGRSALDLVDPPERPLALDMLNSMMTGQTVKPLRLTIFVQEGRRRQIEIHGHAIIENDEPVGLFCIARDISFRQRNEDRLRQLSQAVEQSPGTVVITNVDGVIEYVNPKFTELTGYTAEEVLGANPRLLQSGYHPAGFYQEMWDEISNVGGWRGEFANRNKEGGLYWELASISALKDAEGRVTHYIKVAEDITERKRAEEALQRQSRELEALNEASQALTSTLDLEEVLVTTLEEVSRLLGAVASSIWLTDPDTGELVCWQATGPKQSIARGWRLAPGEGFAGWATEHGETVLVGDSWSDERYFRGVEIKSGLELRSILTVPLRVESKVIGVLQMVDSEVDRFDESDVPVVELLAASAAIAIQNARLFEQARQEIVERQRAEDALRQRTVELQDRNRELDAFSHTVAHDLKTPLSLIVGYAELLAEGSDTVSPEQLGTHLRTIAWSGRKMSDIIDELMLFAGVRQMEVETSPLDTGAIVGQALRRLSQMIQETGARVDQPDDWPPSLGYGPWIEEVWVNYISNALTYGGRPPQIELGATLEPDAQVRYWVKDNGDGLTPEEQAQLFAPFTQLPRGRTRGHGLGLSIVLSILDKLGGHVDVESQGEPGLGSTFSFTLPSAVSED